MDFEDDGRTRELREQLLAFMDEHVYPAEPVFAEQAEAAAGDGRGWERVPVTADLKAEARRQGLWNLFLTGRSAEAVRKWEAAQGAGSSLPDPPPDQPAVRPAGRDTGLQPAPRPRSAQLRRAGHRQHGAAGRVRLRRAAGTLARPLLAGDIRSAFCMTEPDVPRRTRRTSPPDHPDGDHYVINGRKWWSSGAMGPRCEIFIVMGRPTRTPTGTTSRQS